MWVTEEWLETANTASQRANSSAFYNGASVLVDKGKAADVIYHNLCKAFAMVPYNNLGEIRIFVDGLLDG